MKAQSFVIGLTTLATAVILPATAFAGYAPSNRATFTCASPVSCDGAEYVTFNSFTNAPNYGDERAFFDVRDASITGDGGYQDTMKVTDGQKLTIRIYVHNDANPNAIGVDNATAKNTELQVQLQTAKGTSFVSAANLSASNANPGTVSDTIGLTGDSPFTVTFDKDSPVNVHYRPNGEGDFVTRALPTASFAGDNVLNANLGDWHGCFNYSATITATVVVHMDKTPPVTPPVTPPKTTPPTVAAPTKLVNTGAGSVIGIFAATTAAGAAAYRFVLGRRLSRQ